MTYRRAMLVVIPSLIYAILCPVAGAQAVAAMAPNAGAEIVIARLSAEFQLTIKRQVTIPQEVLAQYAGLVSEQLAKSNASTGRAQFIVAVDRNPNVQVAMILWKNAGNAEESSYMLIGATRVGTGGTRRFDYHVTPLGAFDHVVDNPDYRAEGSKNIHGIRGYGARGDRVWDFGWQQAMKNWGDAELRQIRLQMHSTDPDVLEPRLGTVGSKGCVRIPSAFNNFLDRHGLLDADYENAAIQNARRPWVWKNDRTPTLWSGRYMVVVDSDVNVVPPWIQK